MKGKIFIGCILTFLTIFTACNDDSLVIPKGFVELSKTELAMESGTESFIEFSITPVDASFNYDVNSPECQLSLKTVVGELITPNYQLSKIEPVLGKKGRYKATIIDLQRSTNYREQISLVLRKEDMTQIESEIINIYFSGNDLFSFAFLMEDNPNTVLKDITANLEGNEINISSPFISSGKLKACFETNAEKVLVNGIEQESKITVNDFSNPIEYKIQSASGKEAVYKINVKFSGLPILIIETPNQASIPNKYSDWLNNTTLTLLNPDGSVNYSGTTGIRGRGNSTWGYPKKPYALKLDKKASILGMPKHKRWVLLANWMDRTLLRNRVAFQIALSTGMEWNPHGEFVEVILNGKHIGNYYLCEHIKVDENRVNISELSEDDTEGDGITGGFIMELDTYYDEINKFKSSIRNLPYMFKDPDEVNEQQFAYMQNFINSMEESLYDDKELADDKYLEYMDIDSYIDWWFVHELAKNGEPGHPKSTYMYKDKLGKLNAGPVWDFDWGTFTPGTSYTVKHTLYYPRLFKNATFVARVKERWNLLKPEFNKIPNFIVAEAERIRHSEEMNHEMWPITKIENKDESMSFIEAVERMKSAYEAKLQWLDLAISKL